MNAVLTGEDLISLLVDSEKERRRARFERGRSPVQRTVRSRNKARVAKYPGKGSRNAWKAEVW